MKKSIFQYSIILFCCLFLNVLANAKDKTNSLKITHIELGYPVPGIPFYHFKAQLELNQPSIIEIEAVVNGKTLRFVNLYRGDVEQEVDKPAFIHRPPSGYALSQDNALYKTPEITGWLKWQPGQDYEIKITVRLKQSAQPSDKDKFVSASAKLTAPNGSQVFDNAWKNYKSVVLSETAGIDRKNEPVEVLLPFYPDEVNDLKREIRVMAVNPRDYSLTEVPSQVFDIQEYLKKDDLSPLEEGQPERHIPLWMPTVTCKVAFLAEVPAKTSRVFLIFYNNDKAMAKSYQTDLRVQGELPGLSIDNDHFNIVLHPNSGHLDQITLKKKSDTPLFHRMETNGAIHWNPDIYAPPRPWAHTADWKHDQNMHSMSGPVLSTSEAWGAMRETTGVDASVRYDFYPGVPYFISTSSMRINETVQCLALRNAEIVFKRELITHAAWYDVIRDKIITYDVGNLAELTELRMEADIPWITFYDKEKGVGFAGINLEYANSGLESRSRLLNPFFYITVGPWVYWARALSLSFVASNMQQVIPAMKGSMFKEKWAYLVYETDKEIPHKPVLDWKDRLMNPLRIQLVEEVDERVSKSLVEVYMDDGKSGWEERETGKHK
jgi:hypothetical protein